MSNAGRQLTHCLQPLHLAQGGFYPLALLDLRDKLSVGCLDFASALSNSDFQCFIQAAQILLLLFAHDFRFHAKLRGEHALRIVAAVPARRFLPRSQMSLGEMVAQERRRSPALPFAFRLRDFAPNRLLDP